MLAYLARLVPAGPGASDVAFVGRGDPTGPGRTSTTRWRPTGRWPETWVARASAPA